MTTPHRLRRAPTRALLAAGASAALLATTMAVGVGPAAADTVIDLTTGDTFIDVNGGKVRFSAFDSSTGTGVFDSFVRIQATGTEAGYNSSGRPVMPDVNTSPTFTRDLPLSDVPLVDINGEPTTDLANGYREVRLDINQVSGDPDSLLSLDVVRVMLSPTASVDEDDSPNPGDAGFGTLVWDLPADTWIKLDYDRAPGSGNGDMQLLIPNSAFGQAGQDCAYNPAVDCGQYVYLYSEFGQNHASNDGFEEWSVRKLQALAADKTADPAWSETHVWTVDKSVDPASHALFAGASADSGYDVDVTETVTTSGFVVTGEIRVSNDAESQRDGIRVIPSQIADVVRLGTTDVATGTITACDGVTDLTASVTLVKGAKLICDYTASLGDDAEIDTTYSNTATIPYWDKNGPIDLANPVGTLEAYEEFQFTAANKTVVGPVTVDVTDTFDGGQPEVLRDDLGGSELIEYPRTFDCSSDTSLYAGDGTYDYAKANVAKVLDGETVLDESSANVDVDCYAPIVAKDATATFDRDWTWTIDKTGDQTALTLSTGQAFTVSYDVVVTATKADSNWTVAGSVDVTNPHPTAAMPVTITDTITPGGLAATITGCSVDGQALTPDNGTWSIPATKTAECGYTYSFGSDPGTGTYTNTATVTLNGIDFTDTAEFAFTTPTTETDECIDVSDTLAGSLGTVCADQSPVTFSYPYTVGPYEVCGDYTVDNTASFVANDTGATGSDIWSVAVNVPCEGCTLTQGYWKTHSEYGPAPYDDTWAQLANGADTPFFSSGQTYYQILWTPPQGGNAYLILAHQWIAAQLNMLDGTGMPADVQAAFDAAQDWFTSTSASPANPPKGKARADALGWATILEGWNAGQYHCSEDATSVA